MFFRNFSKLLSTSFAIQILSLILYPFITRTWSPEVFGEFSFIISIGGVLSIFATGQYHIGGMAEKDPIKSQELFQTAKFFSLAFSSFLLLVVCFAPSGGQIYLLPFYVFSFTMFEIERIRSIKTGSINKLSLSQVFARLSSNLLKLIPGPSLFLVASELVGSTVGLLTLKGRTLKEVIVLKKPSAQILRDYHKYPVYYSANLGAQLLCLEIPAILFGFYHKNYMVGIYGLCQRLMIQPMTTVSNNVFSALFSIDLTPAERVKKSIQIAGIVIASGFALKILYNFFGEPILLEYLGSQWRDGVKYFNLFSYLLITKPLTSITLANYISSYRLERSITLRTLQIISIALAFWIFKNENFNFFTCFVIIDMTFDVVCFLISLKK